MLGQRWMERHLSSWWLRRQFQLVARFSLPKTSGIQRGHEDLDRHALPQARVWGLSFVGNFTSSAARISIVQIRATTGFCPGWGRGSGAALPIHAVTYAVIGGKLYAIGGQHGVDHDLSPKSLCMCGGGRGHRVLDGSCGSTQARSHIERQLVMNGYRRRRRDLHESGARCS